MHAVRQRNACFRFKRPLNDIARRRNNIRVRGLREWIIGLVCGRRTTDRNYRRSRMGKDWKRYSDTRAVRFYIHSRGAIVKTERGDILLAVIPLLAALCFLTAAILLYVTIARMVVSDTKRVEERTAALAGIRAILEKIEQDPSPEADSPYDGIAGGTAIVDDLSALCLSRQKEEISATRASSTPGYLNPFLASDAAILATAEKRIIGGKGFETLVAELRALPIDENAKSLSSRAVKQCSPNLFPVISASSPVNVNFAPPEVIRQALTDSGAGTENARLLAEDLMAMRRSQEILPAALSEREGFREIPPKARMAIGTKTWFWKISLNLKGHEYSAYASALPDDGCRVARSMTMLSFERTK
jgi:hypothetical protein